MHQELCQKLQHAKQERDDAVACEAAWREAAGALSALGGPAGLMTLQHDLEDVRIQAADLKGKLTHADSER